MKPEAKAKFNKIFWPIMYFSLAIALAVSIGFAARKTSYVMIYVSGTSMVPTLYGGTEGGAKPGESVDFGEMDPSKQALSNLKRFNIITTYFPYGWEHADYDANGKLLDGASYKIKRLIGFPGETVILDSTLGGDYTFTINKGNDTTLYKYNSSNKGWEATFNGQKVDHVYKYEIKNEKSHSEKHHTYSLGEDEYFVMGDNWDTSSDSSTNMLTEGKSHIKFYNLQGLLIRINGKADMVLDEKTGKTVPGELHYSTPVNYYTEL